MNLDNVRSELGTALGSVSGLRVFSYTPSTVEPPAAIVGQGSVTYDATFAGSMTSDFGVLVIVARADDRNANSRLNDYLTPTGSGSIKVALEADQTVGGEASYVTVTGADAPGEVEYGGTQYLAVQFDVEVGD